LLFLLPAAPGGATEVKEEEVALGQRAWHDIELLTIIARFQFTRTQMQQLAPALLRLQPQVQRLEAQEKGALAKAQESYLIQRTALVRGLQITPEVQQKILAAEAEARKYRDEANGLYDTALEQITALLTPEQNRMVSEAIQNTRAGQALLRYQMEQQRIIERQLEYCRQALQTVRSWDQTTFMQRAPLAAGEVTSQFLPQTSPYFEPYSKAVYQFFGDVIGLKREEWQQREYEVTLRFLGLLREAAGQGNPQAQQPFTLTPEEFKDFLLDPNTPFLLQTRAPYVVEETYLPPGGRGN
jgi:hypothetical protein